MALPTQSMLSAAFFKMENSAQGGSGEEGLEQFVLFVCLSDEWKCLWERTWVASSPFLCRKCKGG